MQITVELNENHIEKLVVSECFKYMKEKQMTHILHEISKQVAQEVKGEVVDSGLVEKRVEEVVKRVENSLMARVNRQFGKTVDKALDITAKSYDSPVSDNIEETMKEKFISAIRNFRDESDSFDERRAYQRVLNWIKENYGEINS